MAGLGPDHGLRLELPNHLKSAMGALQSVSYEIKQRHQEAKRNVLFDDSEMDLVLDFSLGDGKPWRRITSKQALDRKKRTSGKTGKHGLDDCEIDSLLDDRIEERGSDADP